LLLTVAYCPDEFSGAGAIVSVDPNTGNFVILGKFQWPSDIIGCPADYDPVVTFDTSSGLLYMFFDDADILTVVNLAQSEVEQTVTPSNVFFTGYENMAWSSSKSYLQGVSGTVTENGYCSDGCFQFGNLELDGTYTAVQNIPYRAMMDDSHFLDESTNTFYIQASYDLRSEDQWCNPDNTQLCMLQIDSQSGDLKSWKFTNWTIYKYGASLDNDDQMTVWMEGFPDLCQHPYNDFLFAKVDLDTATATPISCIPRDVTVQMDEWISSFSLDGTLFATGSGDAFSGIGQLLVFHVPSGQVVLNSNLPGLAKQLNTADGLFFVWSVDFA
jgi:hypothetical protein